MVLSKMSKLKTSIAMNRPKGRQINRDVVKVRQRAADRNL